MDKIVAGRKKVKVRGHILEVFLERIRSPPGKCSNRKLNKTPNTPESKSNGEPGGRNACFLVLFRNIFQTSRLRAIFEGGIRLILDVDCNCGLLVTAILLVYDLNDSVVIL